MGKTIEIDVKVDTKSAVKGVDNLDKSTKKLGKTTEDLSESSESTTKGLNAMGGATGTVVTGFKAMVKGALAFIATPIGLVLAAVAAAVLAVKTAFTSSEAGQNKYNKIMSILGSLLGNLTDKLADFGNALIEVFENPMKSLENFADALKKNIIIRFEGMLELIPQLGKAISALWNGDFAEASKIAVDALGKVTSGVENMSEKIHEAAIATAAFIDELEREAKLAGDIADNRAKADKLERDLTIERAIADRKISEFREIAARRDLYNSDQRKEALESALLVNEEIIGKEIAAAKLRAEAITLENTLSDSNKDALQQEATAKALVIQLETKKLNLQKRLGTELAAINLELAAKEAKEAKAAETKELKDAEIKEKELQLIRSSGQRAIEIELELKALRAEAGLTDPNATNEQIQAAYDAKKEVENALFDLDLIENEQRFIDGTILEQERNNQKALLEFEHQKNIEKIKANSIESISKKEKDASDLKSKNEMAAAQGSVKVAGDVLSAVSGIMAEGSAEAKALAIGAATMQGLQGVQAAYASTAAIPIVGPVLAPVAAGAAALVAAKNIQKIASTDTGGKNGGASGGSSFSAPVIASAPSLNSETLFTNGDTSGVESENLGTGAGINQIKAIVVESDITTIQNKINDIETASEIG